MDYGKNTIKIETTPQTEFLLPQSEGDPRCGWAVKISARPLAERGILLESRYGYGEVEPCLLALTLGDYTNEKILYAKADSALAPYFLHLVIDTRILTDTPQAVEKFCQGFRTAISKFDEGIKVNKDFWALP